MNPFRKYIYERKTHNLEVPFFVKEHFERDYKGSIKRIESQVEDDYVSTLRTSCFRERNYSMSNSITIFLFFQKLFLNFQNNLFFFFEK